MHFSDAHFRLTEWQRSAFILHSLEEATRIRRAYVTHLMSTANTDSVDYCWYFLVRLIVIEYALSVRAGASPAVQHHIGLIHSHYSYLVQDLRRFHEMGWLTTESQRDDFERRLIDLAAHEPRLNSIAARIIQDWEQIEKSGFELQFVANVMGSQLHREVEDDMAIYGGRSEIDCDVANSAREQEETLHMLFCLEQAMAPKSDDDQAWHHPLEYIETWAAGRHAIFVDTAVEDFCDEELSNGQKLQLALLERMAAQGFRWWLFSKPETDISNINRWLKENGDSRSVKSICDGVQRYLTSRPGRLRPSLSDILMLPRATQPTFVTREVRYWEAVWSIKERAAAELRLFMTQHENERSAAIKWMRPRGDRKYIVVGDGGQFQDHCLSKCRISRKKSLVVRHRLAAPAYGLSLDAFNLFWALCLSAYEVGRKNGWGDHQSAVLPIQGNRRFLAAFESGELQEALPELNWQFLLTASNDFADAVIFTAEDDGEEDHHGNAPFNQPATVDFDALLVGTGY